MYKRPKISIIIPVYNAEDFLRACLESVCSQTFTDYEVILINDGSTDSTSSIISSFKSQHPNFICLEQPNRGAAAARNAGLSQAEGEYVCFLDGDDFLAPDFLEKMFQAIQTGGAELAVCPQPFYDTLSGHTRDEDAGVFKNPLLCGLDRAGLFEGFSCVMSVCGKLVLREMLIRENITFPVQPVAEDIFPAVQMLSCARKITVVPDTAAFYRVGRGNSLSSRQEGKFDCLFAAFGRARIWLLERGEYAAAARGFEYVRLTCILSHISAYGLTESQWKQVCEEKASFLSVPLNCLRGRSWRLRAKFMLLKAALKYGFSYPRALKRVQRFVSRPLKRVLGKASALESAKK